MRVQTEPKLLILIGLSLLAITSPAWSAGPKKPAPAQPVAERGKRVVVIPKFAPVRVELPDGQVRDLGEDLRARLTTKLVEGGVFIVADPEPEAGTEGLTSLRAAEVPNLVWAGSYVPSATIKLNVDALSFSTGERGTRMFYGFDERLHNRWNDGTEGLENEFQTPGIFGRAFADRGDEPENARSGLDLGEGLSINLLFAWLEVKYARYFGRTAVTVELDAPFADRLETFKIDAQGKGYFFDVAGAYQSYMLGLRFARRDAMLRSFEGVVDGIATTLQSRIGVLPAVARVDGIVMESGEPLVLLGTGLRAEFPVGLRLRSYNGCGTILEVAKSVQSGSIARVLSGPTPPVGCVFVEDTSGTPAQARAIASVELRGLRGMLVPESAAPRTAQVLPTQTVTLPEKTLSKPAFPMGSVPETSTLSAIGRSIVGLFWLPYRIWRYQQYDRPYAKDADARVSGSDARSLPEWRSKILKSAWAKRVELGGLAALPRSPLVAVIDSGVDYNHPVLHDNLWMNDRATTDTLGRSDRYGWDFVSNDSRPADDHYHGTELASLVLAVAPESRILPIKAFNPYGMTSSAALLASVRYAIDAGADVILCAWTTTNPSKALREALSEASAAGVLVVTTAGDTGWDSDALPNYPAGWSTALETLVTVGSLNADGSRYISNRSKTKVTLSTYGEAINSASPRAEFSTVTSSGGSAALVAGFAARLAARENLRGAGLKARLVEISEKRPELQGIAGEGYVLLKAPR